ncbi:hypothetical protein KP509_17G056600 [Ceratopteris richardii]|uniref:Thioesterase domain-containing protein n=1 Tax=Ceratopteris richardii TaxID=49495 RepID=A0A8T2SZQ1_CERRI|nr:hypothetical protein KP509_17G056600 [Ceratopteris richardii]
MATSVEGKEQQTMGDAILEESLKFIGFRLEHVSPGCVRGRFTVDNRSAQLFGVLHGGVSGLVAESLASLGAVAASGMQRVAGLQLSINHLTAAPIGTEVFVLAKPSRVGKRIQVWDVTFFDAKTVEQNDNYRTTIAVARVTIMAGLAGQSMGDYEQELRLQARL